MKLRILLLLAMLWAGGVNAALYPLDSSQFSGGSVKSGAPLTNINQVGTLTNLSGNIRLKALENGDAIFYGLHFWSTADLATRGIIECDNYHGGNGTEFRIISSRSGTFEWGLDGSHAGFWQIGTTPSAATPSLGCVMGMQYAIVPDGTTPLGYSYPFAYVARYWNGSAQIARSSAFELNCLDAAGNTELKYYSRYKGLSHTFSDDASNASYGGLGTNNIHWQNGLITNYFGIGSGIGGNTQLAITTGRPGLDVSSAWFPGFLIGADVTGSGTYSNRTANTDKAAVMAFAPKDDGVPVMFVYEDTRGGNDISGAVAMMGGGSGTLTPLDGWEFYAGSSSAVRFKISSTAVTSKIPFVATGVTDASSAAAANVGEFISAAKDSGSGQALQTTVPTNITSISLTAGDWDVSGNANFAGSTATVTATAAGIVTTANTIPSDGSEVYSGVTVTLVSETDGVTLPRKRVNVSTTTTVYLTGRCTFTAGSVSAFGSITARRIR